ncbi:hypothetical protein MVEN_02459200 [Mycena venus]|uniref:C2H2-type domain-containing protein n=1 Tax=Mycena venus TaxID=2733690 RepID=A0A8H7CAQ1_9AGAR|nr:hypothetical protein MVEN_02459200 [Mycena venus]
MNEAKKRDGPNEASRAQLRAAIYKVPEARLRHVLVGLADTVPAVYHALARELVVVSPTTRVVVPRWETCPNCGETYDVNADEDEEECTFHPGELEVNEAKFPDWDEDCHGPMDSEHNREQYPENFSWTCCNGDGMTEGVCNREARRSRSQETAGLKIFDVFLPLGRRSSVKLSAFGPAIMPILYFVGHAILM